MDESELLDDIDTLWPEVAVGFKANHCILATRTAIEVARYFGFVWKPFPVDLAIFNQEGWDAFEAQIPVREWPDQAWSLGAVCQNELKKDGWDGHLVVESWRGDWLADLSAGQFDRPAKGIHLPSWRLDTEGEPPWTIRSENGLVMWLKPRPDIYVYRQTGDWKENYEPLAAAIIRELK